MTDSDPYKLAPSKLEEPPTTLRGSLRHIGPGFVLSASIAGLAWAIPILWALVFKLIENPVFMVFVGGFVTSIILLVVLFAAIYFKHRDADPRLDLGRGFAIRFWASAVLIVLVGIWSAAKPFLK